jgi:hypothetical protein
MLCSYAFVAQKSAVCTQARPRNWPDVHRKRVGRQMAFGTRAHTPEHACGYVRLDLKTYYQPFIVRNALSVHLRGDEQG